MLIHKGFKYRLYPTPEQESQLLQQAGNTRFLWNKLLESNIKTYETTKKLQFSHEMIVSIPKLKEEFEFLKLSFSQSLQQVGRQLDKALKDTFKKAKGFPKFKKRRNRDSFTVPQKFACNKNNVKLPKIGKVKWILHRNWEGSPKFLTVSRDGNQWYCSITCEVNLPDKQLPDIKTCQDNIAGIDVGLKEFATLSDNTVIPNPRHLNKKLKKLKREQRWLSRKTKGSNNRIKQIEKVQTVHRKVRNTRKDFLHKITSNMIAKYSGVVLEDLNIRGMMKNSKLARHISDVGWYEFNRMLEYKFLWNVKHYIKINRWYASSKICNECGSKKVDLKLEDRIYVCEDCGNITDRDFNASKNILAEGLNVLLTTVGHTGSNACGEDKVSEVFPKGKKLSGLQRSRKKNNSSSELEAPRLALGSVTNGNWRIVDTEPFRAIDVPEGMFPTIFLPHGIRNSKQSLEEIIHETLHAAHYYSPEDKVTKIALEAAERLWESGLRLSLLKQHRQTKPPVRLIKEINYVLYTIGGSSKEKVANDISKVLWKIGWNLSKE